MYTVILYFLLFICFCINKLKEFENWSSENRYVPWSLLLFTCIILSWISYPKLLNQVVVQKDSVVEKSSYEDVINIKQNQFVSLDLSEKNDENFTYKKLGEGYGTLGDTYGALNTLFTGLAFGGLIISIFLQMLELRATRKELSEQKDALKGQQEEFIAQTKILNRQIALGEKQKNISKKQSLIVKNQLKESQRQNFINQFNMLMEEKRFKNKGLKIKVPFSTNSEFIDGNMVLHEYAKKFRSIRKNYVAYSKDKDFFKDHWYKFLKERYQDREYSIYNYFKIYDLLFEIVENEECLDQKEKERFFSIIKASISTDEKSVWMWVGTFKKSTKKLCNTYQILSSFHSDDIVAIGYDLFERGAFDDSDTWNNSWAEAKKNDPKLKNPEIVE
ncbi:hypothetical protein [Acinetobacter johnsonii]|uniref:hypothetical protein n=1 Tax=Acinetobacter johnsonii TaxID=40214 RepID=UPI001F25CBC8|nr:hypothetical protein [Acinetobacter johnsonii]